LGVLYVDRSGLEIRARGGAIEIHEASAGTVQRLPSALVERIVLRADTRLSSATLASLAEAGIGLLAIGGRAGQRVALLVGHPARDARARIGQCQRACDEAWASAFVSVLLRAKLRGQRRLLLRALARRPDLRRSLLSAAVRLERATIGLESVGDRSSLRGLEGAGANAYFGAYRELFAESLGFRGRRRRPPPDPVNASLSLVYTLLHANAVQACWTAGLDPMVGFLHVPEHGRESMACDLVEPWRPHVDEWVWAQFRERALREEHFGVDGAGACVIGKAARAHLYTATAPLMRRLSRSMRRHTALIAESLRDEAEIPEPDAWEEDEDFGESDCRDSACVSDNPRA
jgi:CRISPR-associated protein Cas1